MFHLRIWLMAIQSAGLLKVRSIGLGRKKENNKLVFYLLMLVVNCEKIRINLEHVQRFLYLVDDLYKFVIHLGKKN